MTKPIFGRSGVINSSFTVEEREGMQEVNNGKVSLNNLDWASESSFTQI